MWLELWLVCWQKRAALHQRFAIHYSLFAIGQIRTVVSTKGQAIRGATLHVLVSPQFNSFQSYPQRQHYGHTLCLVLLYRDSVSDRWAWCQLVLCEGSGQWPNSRLVLPRSGAQPPQAEAHGVNPFSEEDLFLSLYDLCHGDHALLDAIRAPERTPLLPSTLVPNTAMALPRVSTERRARPTSNSNPTLCNNLSYVPPSVIAHPSLQDERVSTFPSSARYMPYSRGGKSEVLVQTDEDNPGMKGHTQSQLSKKDYIERYGVTSIRRLDGLDTNDLNSHGQWRELLVDTLEQIGLPYPLYGLKPLIAEAYGFKIIHGQEKHPENRWQVCLFHFVSIRTCLTMHFHSTTCHTTSPRISRRRMRIQMRQLRCLSSSKTSCIWQHIGG